MVGKDGGPAFPAKEEWNDRGVAAFNHYTGMSLRDYFAAAALQGILANAATVQSDRFKDDEGWHSPKHIADLAYETADAMMAVRSE